MVTRMMDQVDQLRFVPTLKRIRIDLDGVPIADSSNAVLVWEPKRLLPSYAVPEHDVTATLVPAPATELGDHAQARVISPREPFRLHTAAGDPLTVVTPAAKREAAAFRLADPDLAGYVVFESGAFSWREEDEVIVGHPRDPFHRIDIRKSERPVRLEYEGQVLAESMQTKMLFEGVFPFARYYVPREDVRVELIPSALTTTCPYKGHASYYSVNVGGAELADIAWSYEDPLDDAMTIRGLICFHDERLGLFIDDTLVERPTMNLF